MALIQNWTDPELSAPDDPTQVVAIADAYIRHMNTIESPSERMIRFVYYVYRTKVARNRKAKPADTIDVVITDATVPTYAQVSGAIAAAAQSTGEIAYRVAKLDRRLSNSRDDI